METTVQTSKLSSVSVGQAGAPHRKKFYIGNGQLSLTQGGLIHSITVNGDETAGNPGPGERSLVLAEGEYWNSFEVNSSPYLSLGNVVNGFKMTTNQGRVLEVNTDQLPTKSEEGVSAIVKDCFVYAIEVVYGTLINQITFHYISDFDA